MGDGAKRKIRGFAKMINGPVFEDANRTGVIGVEEPSGPAPGTNRRFSAFDSGGV
jgi:hypothetical protein